MAKIDEWLQEDKLILLEGWTREGLTLEQISKNIGINECTIYDWKKKEPKISEALKKGKEVADYEVENALFKKCFGYNVPVKKTFKLKRVIYENGKKAEEYEELVEGEDEIYVPADTTAQIFWLKKRQKEKWGDKEENNNGNINERILNIANLLNNPQPNRSDEDVQ